MNCLICGKPIRDKWLRFHPNRKRKFCSRACSIKNMNEQVRKKDNRVWFTCVQCGKKFKDYKTNKLGKLTFCSRECAGKYYLPKGEKNRFWKGGVAGKISLRCHQAWWVKLRKKVYKRDNYTCQMCGKTNCRVECHHIIPERTGGTHRMDNLITLCPSCHKLVEWQVANGQIFNEAREKHW